MATRLAAALVAHGAPVFYSPVNMVGAQQWHDEIGAALGRCDWFTLLLSPDAVASKWMKRELLFALENDRYIDRIVPIQTRDSDFKGLSWTFSAFWMVDTSGGFVDGCRRFLRIRRIGLRPDVLPSI